jgi:aryl-alcohol dehydrogenase-like predicted oxidoreductase
MEYVRLGDTGLKVSRICLGCMSFGIAERGGHAWALNEEQSRPIIKKALEAGINFFDTANVYSAGTSEEITGRALRDFAKRNEIVLATKVHGVMGPGPNQKGLSRKAILQEIDASLKRLGMDYVDLYQIHRFDPETPMEETLEALHDVAKAGKARYIGASSMYAWQFAKMLGIAEKRGWTRFVSMQNHYNLIYREEEREMMRLCLEEGVGVIPWSPLARGILARPWGEAGTHREKTDQFTKKLYGPSEASDKQVVERVAELSKKRGTPMAAIALSWLLSRPGVTAPILGVTKPQQLEEGLAALSIRLNDEEIKRLEEPYIPHAIAGFN